jgi:hypothetical protein
MCSQEGLNERKREMINGEMAGNPHKPRMIPDTTYRIPLEGDAGLQVEELVAVSVQSQDPVRLQ